VVGHELAHIVAGHLDDAPLRMRSVRDGKVNAEFYQLSQRQEFEADMLGWEWYQQAWPHIPLLDEYGENSIWMPLFLFHLMALVERNEAYDPYSDHPPAVERMARLVERLTGEAREHADGMLHTARTMPDFSTLPPEMLAEIDAVSLESL
ncbi:MAG TPA: hypothetical protein VGB15_22615, partial [Longimicrobium sp.]